MIKAFIASYPKAGNTWVRLFLLNYMSDNAKSITDLDYLGQISSSKFIYALSIYDVDKLDKLSPKDVEQISYDVLRNYTEKINSPLFLKTHQLLYSNGIKQLPSELVKTIYLIRNPISAAASFVDYFKVSKDVAINNINDGFYLQDKNTGIQVPYFIGGWSQHIQSWKEAENTLVIRYEDLVLEPHKWFEKIIKHLGFKFDKERLDRSIRDTTIDKLQKQEAEDNSKIYHKDRTFFNDVNLKKGKDIFNDEQINRIVEFNKELMKEYNY